MAKKVRVSAPVPAVIDLAVQVAVAMQLGHRSRNSYENESTADCLAGAFARDAERNKLLEAGDEDEAIFGMQLAGDPEVESTGNERYDRLIQARMSAAIARICGFDLSSDRVQTFILASLAGDAVKDLGKAAGIDLTQGVTKTMMKKVSAEVVEELQEQVGKRLIAATARKGATSLARGIPLIGGVVGGVFDATACNVVGRTAKALFYPRRRSRTA